MSLRHLHGDDRGAVAVIVAISLIVLMGMAAMAIDGGDLWQTRRGMVTATDAAALAGAQLAMRGASEGDACDEAEAYLERHEDDRAITMVSCELVGTGGGGYLDVAAETTVDLTFARVLGFEQVDVASTTTADFTPSGLRPIALCEEMEEVEDWLDAGVGAIHEITYSNNVAAQCGDVPGNWGNLGWGDQSNATYNERLRNGYEGPPPEIGDCITGNTGAIANSNSSSLDTILHPPYDTFVVVLYDDADEQGATAEFCVSGFAEVRLHDYRVNGAQHNRSFTFELVGVYDDEYPDHLSTTSICNVDEGQAAARCAD